MASHNEVAIRLQQEILMAKTDPRATISQPRDPAAKMSPLRRRNRQALLDAAAVLMDEGIVPTIADAADRAEISRATAYRYFSSPEHLQNEAALDAIAKRIDALPLEALEDASVEDAVASLIGRVHQMSLDHEVAFRTMLRLSLDPAGGSRGGRRMGWIGALLDRAGVPEDIKMRAVPALSLLCGIEAHIVLSDVCGLKPDAARNTLDWAARVLTRAAIAEKPDRFG
jgi:AcrR family transcriptional regulator